MSDSLRYTLWILVTTVFVTVMRGVALSYAWEWFITPKYGLPAPAVTEAMGMVLILFFVPANARFPPRYENYNGGLSQAPPFIQGYLDEGWPLSVRDSLVQSVFWPLAILLLAWIIKVIF